jgi:DNA mismatch repair ATPase MutS
MVSNNTTLENELKNSEQPAIKPTFNKHNRREELNYLYSQIIKEIDERYSYMEEMKNLGKNMDQVIMVEIKERIDELKKIQKMIDEFDK